MRICNCSNSNLFMLLALSHVAVVLFSYSYFSFYNRHDHQLVEVSLQTAKREALVTNSIVTPRRSYDFFYFVLTWPGSYDPQWRREKVPKNFTIHGLWPNYNNGESPANCPGSTFNLRELKKASLVKNLEVEWPSIDKNKTNKTFWEQEWKKHGTSSEDELDQIKYFNSSLRLKSEINILQTLKNKDVFPSKTRIYSLKTITNAITEGVKAPRIRCNKNGSQLLEIRFCVDLKLSFIDCTDSSSVGKCRNEIKFPTI